MSDNLALEVIRALSVPNTRLLPHKIDQRWDYHKWSSNGVWYDRHERIPSGDTITLWFRLPDTKSDAILHFQRDVNAGGWYCLEVDASVTDEVMSQALGRGIS